MAFFKGQRQLDGFPQLLDALAEKEHVLAVASGAGDPVLASRIWFDAWAIRSELRPAPLERPKERARPALARLVRRVRSR